MTTIRTAYWTETEYDGQASSGGELALTGLEHAELSDDDLLTEACVEADRQGIDLSVGRLLIGDWVY